jgi:hypothetical protein
MMNIINKSGYNIIPNPYVNTSNLGKIILESYRIPKSKIYSFELMILYEIFLMFPSIQTGLYIDRFNSYYG